MDERLIELEREALQLKNDGRAAEAAELFSKIVKEEPGWEHGNGLLNLAQCYEDLGRFELAERFYKSALEYEPTSELLLGGYASFLFLHGAPEDAFGAHLALLRSYRRQGSKNNIHSCLIALDALGQRLGWSRDMVAQKIANEAA